MPASTLSELRLLLAVDLKDLYGLMDSEDGWEELVSLWEDVQEFRRDLGELNTDLEAKIYGLQDKERPYGDKVVVRYRASSEKWDHDEVRRRIRKFCADSTTGEVDEVHVAEIERRAAAVSYWRIGDLPFEVDEDVRAQTYGAKKIRVEPQGGH